jgi:hypothetical protein
MMKLQFQMSVEDYLAAKPDPIYAFSAPVCGHMNADHDAVSGAVTLALARHLPAWHVRMPPPCWLCICVRGRAARGSRRVQHAARLLPRLATCTQLLR